jgi:hypothetical protein
MYEMRGQSIKRGWKIGELEIRMSKPETISKSEIQNAKIRSDPKNQTNPNTKRKAGCLF